MPIRPPVFSILLCLVVTFATGFASCGPKAQSDGSYSYRTTAPSDSNGTGRIFLGREIASVTTHRGGAEWLERPNRENEEFPNRLVQSLDLKPTDVVADIGAGTGYFSFRISERVPHGRVIAVDIQPEMLVEISSRKDSLGVRNVQTILGSDKSPNLPESSIDLALLVASYHEFYYPYEMMSSIYASLKPGGQVVLIEYRGEDDTIDVSRQHRLTEEQARKELGEVGFRWRQTRDILPQQHLLIFEKPFEQ